MLAREKPPPPPPTHTPPTHSSPAPEELHAKQGEDHNEEEEEEEQADDGLHGAHERHHQVPEGGPVPGNRVNRKCFKPSAFRKSSRNSAWLSFKLTLLLCIMLVWQTGLSG